MDKLQQVTENANLVVKKYKKTSIAIGAIIGYSLISNIYTRVSRRYNKSPPGPVSNIFTKIYYYLTTSSSEDIMTYFDKMTKKYGDVYTVSFFGLNNIVIANAKLCKKLFADKKFKYLTNNRFSLPDSFPTIRAKDGEISFAALSGKEALQRRRIFTHVFGKMLTADFMNECMGKSIQRFLIPFLDKSQSQNKGILIREICDYLSFQSIFYANYRKFCQMDSKFYIDLRDSIETVRKGFANKLFVLLIMFPNFCKKFNIMQDYTENITKFSLIMNKLMEERIKERKLNNSDKAGNVDYFGKSYESDSNSDSDKKELLNDEIGANEDIPTSYLDTLIDLYNDGKISRGVMEADLGLVFFAGFGNVSQAIEYSLVLLCKHPDIQKQIRKELLENLGKIEINKNGNFKMFDFKLINKLYKFRALVYELLRLSCVAQISLGHVADKEFEFEWKNKTYRVLKGNAMLINIRNICNGGQYNTNEQESWKNTDTDKICLQNWLDSNGKFKINNSFMLFGIGNRDCPGKAFVIKEMEIIIAHILLNYNVTFDSLPQGVTPQNFKIEVDPSEFLRILKPQVPIKFNRIY